uniref:Uncharacterized protein n=1 Tax=Macrostomum lignano TaxID=282301 RepID=A0A1I8ITX4_9PLAT
MSCKLRRCSDGLLGRLRSSRHLSRTPSPAEDVLLNSPDAAGASSAAAAAPGASAEGRSSDLQDNLQSCLYNLQAVQYHIQIIERAIFPQAQSGRNSALAAAPKAITWPSVNELIAKFAASNRLSRRSRYSAEVLHRL